jgi:3-hydroxyisobutyrate dehydrogenase
MNCEILQAGESYGVSAEKIIDVFNKSNARSFISEKRFPDHILNEKFDGKSVILNLKKDLNMANKLLKSLYNEKTYTSFTSKKLNKIDSKFNEDDFTTIYKNWKKIFN